MTLIHFVPGYAHTPTYCPAGRWVPETNSNHIYRNKSIDCRAPLNHRIDYWVCASQQRAHSSAIYVATLSSVPPKHCPYFSMRIFLDAHSRRTNTPTGNATNTDGTRLNAPRGGDSLDGFFCPIPTHVARLFVCTLNDGAKFLAFVGKALINDRAMRCDANRPGDDVYKSTACHINQDTHTTK